MNTNLEIKYVEVDLIKPYNKNTKFYTSLIRIFMNIYLLFFTFL